MIKAFVSGSTGFIGSRLVAGLAESGISVHALYRSPSKAQLIRQPGVTLYKGDILDEASLFSAMEGCDQVYHVAAFAGVWSKDPSLIYRLNVDGALNVIRSAHACGIKRVVITSTAGILGPSEGEAVNESTPSPSSFFTPYEASKFRLEQTLKELRVALPEVVVVNPTRVYGPGFLSESNGVTKMIGQYLKGNWRFIPGNGKSSGNYVFVEDVVKGHILAMARGKAGERYVLGGENITYNQLFGITREVSGVSHRLFHIPLWLMLTLAGFMKFFAGMTGKPPLIVPGLVRKFNHNWIVSSNKAITELGYAPLDARAGIRKTIEWLQD
ncbi:MAG: SDR family oxidoreductase [Bacteroidota bacterium]